MSGGGNGGVGGTNGAVTAQPRPVESPFGSSMIRPVLAGPNIGGNPTVEIKRDPYGYGSQVQPRPYSPPQLTMTYEAAQMRQMQQDVKSPAEQAAIDAALAGGPGGAPVSWADDRKIGLSTGLMSAAGSTGLVSAVGSAPAVQQPCPQQPYGVMKPANPFQPQNFEQRLSALEEWQKTRV